MAGRECIPARAVVDLEAIRWNVAALAAHAPTAQVMAVVKADAYGHGLGAGGAGRGAGRRDSAPPR